MKIYLFQSTRELDVFGFTSDETGGRLPAELGPWTWTRSGERGTLETESDTETPAGHGSSDPMMAAIERDGFYVARSETLSRLTGIPWVN
jgi:hypothetical protein